MKMKRALSLLLALVMSLAMFAPAFAAEADAVEYIEHENGVDIVLKNVCVLDNGWVCITQEGPNDNSRSYPERESVKNFKHDLNDRNGNVMATLDSTVTGIYSQADNYAMMTGITGTFSGEYASRFSCNPTFNGDIGVLHIYFYGAEVSSISYKIFTNGNIQIILQN